MTVAVELSMTQWKQLAFGLALLASLLFAVMALILIPRRITDERLLGTWQSDAERTIAELQANRTFNDEQLAGLRKLFGTLQITYVNNGTFTYQLTANDPAEKSRYEVIGRDSHSVVIREIASKPSELQSLGIEQSEISHIHFDSSDSYWIIPGMGTSREYFQRVR